MKIKPDEEKFESHIEKYFNSVGYKSFYFKEYDRNLCLIKNEIVEFIKNSQKEKWDKLQEIHGENAENKILNRINSELARRGVIDLLRNKVIDNGVSLDLCYFEPKSDLNSEHINLFKLNQFSLIRQMHYSIKNEKSIDMVLFLNGIPVGTME